MKDNRLFCLLNAVFSAMWSASLWAQGKHIISVLWAVLFVAWAVLMILEIWKR
jgi:hypothetical protein